MIYKVSGTINKLIYSRKFRQIALDSTNLNNLTDLPGFF